MKRHARSHYFEHAFLPRTEITNNDTDNGRYYTTPVGVFPSVTTIVGRSLDKTYLERWRNRIGKEEAAKITYQAGVRGSSVHDICERYILNREDFLDGEPPFNIDSFRSLQPFLDTNIGKVYGAEHPLYSTFFGTAGRSDLIADYQGRPSVIDYKTSRRIKKEEDILGYFLQKTLYALMAEEMYGISLPQIVCMIAVDHEKPLIFVKEKQDYVGRVLEICRTGS